MAARSEPLKAVEDRPSAQIVLSCVFSGNDLGDAATDARSFIISLFLCKGRFILFRLRQAHVLLSWRDLLDFRLFHLVGASSPRTCLLCFLLVRFTSDVYLREWMRCCVPSRNAQDSETLDELLPAEAEPQLMDLLQEVVENVTSLAREKEMVREHVCEVSSSISALTETVKGLESRFVDFELDVAELKASLGDRQCLAQRLEEDRF